MQSYRHGRRCERYIWTVSCVPSIDESFILATECVSDHGQLQCKEIGGTCVQETDGYYMVNAICLAFGIVFLVAFIIPTARKLQSTCQLGHDYTGPLTVVIRTSNTGVESKDAVDSRKKQGSLVIAFMNVT